jgi:hypothetical protein
MAATQRPLVEGAMTEVSGVPAWRAILSWFIFGTRDHSISHCIKTMHRKSCPHSHSVQNSIDEVGRRNACAATQSASGQAPVIDQGSLAT